MTTDAKADARESITFSVPSTVKQALQELADKEDRTLAAQVSYLFKTLVIPAVPRLHTQVPNPDALPVAHAASIAQASI